KDERRYERLTHYRICAADDLRAKWRDIAARLFPAFLPDRRNPGGAAARGTHNPPRPSCHPRRMPAARAARARSRTGLRAVAPAPRTTARAYRNPAGGPRIILPPRDTAPPLLPNLHGRTHR